MTIFDEIAMTNAKLKKTGDKLMLIKMQVSAPRASEISDMPKGGGLSCNPLEQYMIKTEELTDKYNSLQAKIRELIEEATKQMNAASIEGQTKKMMYLRFVKDMQWKKCAAQLNEEYPNSNWNVNKCFRKYREVLYKLRKLEK